MTDELTDGTLKGWPVSLMIQYDAGGVAYGAHCCAYTDADDNSATLEIQTACSNITDACYGLKPAAAMRKAKALGFIPD